MKKNAKRVVIEQPKAQEHAHQLGDGQQVLKSVFWMQKTLGEVWDT